MNTLRPNILRLALVSGLLACAAGIGDAEAAGRVTVFISDTHFGLGHTVDGKWHPYEDARWPVAFNGFLQSLDGYDTDVDLVILGDLMELWQPAPEMPCTAPTPELGCTKDEVEDLASYILDQHKSELDSLSQFATKRGNHLYIVPGNHDAALLIPEVWEDLHQRFGADAQARISLVPSGVWSSADQKIFAEHGHQIGEDVNGFKKWPDGITTVDHGVTHMTRTWGENFVQSLFNKQEGRIEFIDNLSPESAGIKYKLKTEGVGVVAADAARFLRFNLFETSVSQIGALLGEDGKYSWSDSKARSAGYRLFLAALPTDDPSRDEINSRSDLRDQLDQDLNSPDIVSADEVQSLCMHAAANGDTAVCGTGTLGATKQGLIYTKEQVLAKHIAMRRRQYPLASTFVYGHTHQVEVPREVKATDGKVVTVSNTGAFQRVVNEKQFRKIMQDSANANPPRRITLESLPACYSYIEVKNGLSTQWWWVQEESAAQGRKVSAKDTACWSP